MSRINIATAYGIEDFNKDDVVTLTSIKYHANAIGVEAFGGDTALHAAISRLPNLFKRVSTFVSARFDNDKHGASDFHKPAKFSKKRLPDYMTIRESMIYKAPGQRVQSIELTQVLTEAFSDVVKPLLVNILPELDRFIARVVSDPEEMKSQRTFSFMSAATQNTLKHNAKSLGNCFDPRDNKSECQLKEVYSRNSDIETVVSMLETLNDETYALSTNNTLKQVETISIAMNVLVDKIQNKAPGYDFSPSVVKGLAEAVHAVAELVEFYSVYMFKLREHTTAVKDTLDKLSIL